ncbi:MAG: class I SAM-dependent methyltransferase [Acidobacteriota bacterium]
MRSGPPALRALLHERIRAEGPIPFDRFMETALYHPVHGYYCRRGVTTGAAGDFYTSPDVHEAFGRLVSRQIAEIADLALGEENGSFEIVEAGPGRGALARDIIAALAEERPDLARRTTYTLVEISPALKDVQEETLSGGAARAMRGIAWAGWPEVVDRPVAGGRRVCVIANEFLDALPVHRVERRGDRLLEVHVTSDGEGFREVLEEPSSQELASHLAMLEGEHGIRLLEGQRADIGLRALDWIASLGDLFGAGGRGGAVIIDYGHPARELFDPARRDGTLICYYKHRTCGDPYQRVGAQDMTAHLDFTSIERRGRRAGFDVRGPITQMRFLVALGLAGMVADLAQQGDMLARQRDRLAMHALMAPGGMGEIFKVLLMTRGLAVSSLLGARDPFRTGMSKEASRG